jgi:hypothetical protein
MRRRLLSALSASNDGQVRSEELAMQKFTRIVAAAALAAVAVPAFAFYIQEPGGDPLGDTLRSYSFFPIRPPSTLIDVGSLYSVNADASDFRVICHAARTDVDGLVSESTSWEIQQDLSQKGNFATNVSVDLKALLSGDASRSYVQKVHFSLADIQLQEIALGTNGLIFAKLMSRPECSQAAMDTLNAGGYVCQGQKILRARAEFKLDRDSQDKLGAHVDATPGEINAAVKTAVETQSDQILVVREGRLLAGSVLNYGVAMNPTCLAPKNAHFSRVLPKSRIGRALNFVLFQIVEPLLPAPREQMNVAANN